MGPLVIVVLVGLTVVITTRSIRNTLTDRRSLEEHSKALDTLGELIHQQDWATPLASDLPGARAHVRVVGTEAAPPSPERAPQRGTAPRSPIAPPIAPRTLRPPNAPQATPPPMRTPGGGVPPPSEPAQAPMRTSGRRVPPPAMPTQAQPPTPAQTPAATPPMPTASPPASPPATVGREGYRPPEEQSGPTPATEPVGDRAGSPPADVARTSGHWRVEPASVPVTAPVPVTAAVPVPPQPASGLVLGSVAPTTTSTSTSTSAPSTPSRPSRLSRLSRPAAPAHRRRRALVPIGAVAAGIVVIVGLGVAAVLARSDRSHPRAAALVEPATTVPAPAPSTTATTAVPAVLISSDSQGARYNLASSASVELVPSSPCWVEIRGGSSTGPVVFQGVLRPGDHRPIPATAPIWLRLGNPPGVAIVVNGTPLQPPGRSSSQPYNVTFAPAASG